MSSEKEFSGNLGKQELPPSYDQVAAVNKASAPLLHQTFSESIFGPSTIITLELLSGGFSVRYASCTGSPISCNYSFLIRDFVGNVQAKAQISNLKMTLEDINGVEMLQIRSRESMPSTNATEYFLSKLDGRQVTNAVDVYTFDVLQNSVPIGLIKFDKNQQPEASLKIYHGNENAEIVVKSLSYEDYAIFRDHTSATPLCNIQVPKIHSINNYRFGSSSAVKVIFHQEAGITTEEQLLCSAAAIAIKASLTQLEIKEEVVCRFYFILAGTLIAIFLIIIMASIVFILL